MKKKQKRNLLKVIIFLAVIGIIIALSYGTSSYMNGDTPANTNNTSIVQNNVNNTEKNTVEKNENNVVNNTVNETKNEVKNEVNTAPVNNEVKKTEQSSSTDEEKAIELAKKKYGTTNGVYFRVEQIESNGVYIIGVRDEETTRNLAWYTVDVKAGTVK